MNDQCNACAVQPILLFSLNFIFCTSPSFAARTVFRSAVTITRDPTAWRNLQRGAIALIFSVQRRGEEFRVRAAAGPDEKGLHGEGKDIRNGILAARASHPLAPEFSADVIGCVHFRVKLASHLISALSFPPPSMSSIHGDANEAQNLRSKIIDIHQQ